MNRWAWKDPAVEPPPLRTRIRIRLSDEFRQRFRIEPSCVDGYLHEPGTLPLYGFSVTPGPHVTGWMPIPSKESVAAKEKEAPEDEVERSLQRLGESLSARTPAPARHWQDGEQ